MSTVQIETTTITSKPFNGVRFVLFDFDPLTEQKVRTKLISGGAVDAGQYSQNCTHVIVNKLLYDDPICLAARNDRKALVTGPWVDHSFETGTPLDINSIMYRPVRDLNGIPGAKDFLICLTGYQRQDRDDIMTMVSMMGAQFSKPLVANKVTHLVCYKFEGEKYELASRIKKIKIVNHRWLEDSLRKWTLVPEENYSKSGYELEAMEAEAKDSEEEAEGSNMKKSPARTSKGSAKHLETGTPCSYALQKSNLDSTKRLQESVDVENKPNIISSSVRTNGVDSTSSSNHLLTELEVAEGRTMNNAILNLSNEIEDESAKSVASAESKQASINYTRRTRQQSTPIFPSREPSNPISTDNGVVNDEDGSDHAKKRRIDVFPSNHGEERTTMTSVLENPLESKEKLSLDIHGGSETNLLKSGTAKSCEMLQNINEEDPRRITEGVLHDLSDPFLFGEANNTDLTIEKHGKPGAEVQGPEDHCEDYLRPAAVLKNENPISVNKPVRRKSSAKKTLGARPKQRSSSFLSHKSSNGDDLGNALQLEKGKALEISKDNKLDLPEDHETKAPEEIHEDERKLNLENIVPMIEPSSKTDNSTELKSGTSCLTNHKDAQKEEDESNSKQKRGKKKNVSSSATNGRSNVVSRAIKRVFSMKLEGEEAASMEDKKTSPPINGVEHKEASSSELEEASMEAIKRKCSGAEGRKVETPWFILSGHRFQRKEFKQIIRRLKGKCCKDSHQWSYQATHFIAPSPLRRTEKFFAAAASGRWILKSDYLSACNRAGTLLPEEPYEWHGNGLNEEDGAISLEAPRKWRLLREQTGHGALHGLSIVVYGDCITPTLDTLKRAIKAGGGTLLATSPPYTRFLKCGIDYAIISPRMPRVDRWVQEFVALEIPCITADYLVDYVCKPGHPLEKHVLYKTNVWAERSFANLAERSTEVLKEDDAGGDGNGDVACSACGSRDRGDVMLICGDEKGIMGCGVGMHIDCCDPPLDDVPEDDWFCPKCMNTEGVLDSP